MEALKEPFKSNFIASRAKGSRVTKQMFLFGLFYDPTESTELASRPRVRLFWALVVSHFQLMFLGCVTQVRILLIKEATLAKMARLRRYCIENSHITDDEKRSVPKFLESIFAGNTCPTAVNKQRSGRNIRTSYDRRLWRCIQNMADVFDAYKEKKTNHEISKAEFWTPEYMPPSVEHDGRELRFSSRSLFECKAKYDFQGDGEKHLAFAKGDTIDVFDIIDEKWVRGATGGRKGIFPKDAVEIKIGEMRSSSIFSTGSEGAPVSAAADEAQLNNLNTPNPVDDNLFTPGAFENVAALSVTGRSRGRDSSSRMVSAQFERNVEQSWPVGSTSAAVGTSGESIRGEMRAIEERDRDVSVEDIKRLVDEIKP